MADTHVISALVDKRRRLAGQRNQLKRELERISASIKAVDTTIKQFDPDVDVKQLGVIRPSRRNAFFMNGHGSRLVLEVLRDAEEPMTMPEIVQATAGLAGVELGPENRDAFRATIRNVLGGLENRGRVERTGGVCNPHEWAWIASELNLSNSTRHADAPTSRNSQNEKQ